MTARAGCAYSAPAMNGWQHPTNQYRER